LLTASSAVAVKPVTAEPNHSVWLGLPARIDDWPSVLVGHDVTVERLPVSINAFPRSASEDMTALWADLHCTDTSWASCPGR
jgi:hypothetical protein